MVHAPFGAWPGNCGGYYGSDTPAVIETFAAIARDAVRRYIEKYVTPFADDREMFDKLIGRERLEKLRAAETIQRRLSRLRHRKESRRRRNRQSLRS